LKQADARHAKPTRMPCGAETSCSRRQPQVWVDKLLLPPPTS